MTEEQRKQLEELKKLEQQEIDKQREERETLKDMTSDAVLRSFEVLKEVSGALALAKTKVYGILKSVVELKKDVYDVPDNQQSHTFTTSDGKFRIILGYHVIDDFDDSHTAGVDGVNKFLDSLGVDKNSKMLVQMAKKLLSRDAKGTLNARKVMQLMKLAQESAHKDFIDSVQIIVDAYNPVKSKMYIIAKYRDDNNEWITLPLGITEAKVID